MPLDQYLKNPVESADPTAPVRTAVQPGIIAPKPTGSTIGGPGPAPVPYPEPTTSLPRPLYPEPSTGLPRPLYPEPTSPERPLYPEAGTGPNVPPPRPLYPDQGPVQRPLYPETTTPPATNSLADYLPPGKQFSAQAVVGDSLNNLLSSGSRYIENARQRGREGAASRGLLNSSISAGAAERAGIEASMPILDQMMGLQRQREQNAFGADQSQRDRLFQSDFALLNANIQDWLGNNQFNREFNGQLAMLPIASAAEMWSGLMQLAATDPTVFTPDVLAGYQDFFQTGFNEYISRYLTPPTGG
jgi:hypothetical protein